MNSSSKKKLIFANIVNDIMISYPTESYAQAMCVVTSRKIWLAHEGDCIIPPPPIDNKLKDYACDLLEIDPEKVITLSPTGKDTQYLSKRVIQDKSVSNTLGHRSVKF